MDKAGDRDDLRRRVRLAYLALAQGVLEARGQAALLAGQGQENHDQTVQDALHGEAKRLENEIHRLRRRDPLDPPRLPKPRYGESQRVGAGGLQAAARKAASLRTVQLRDPA